MNAVEETLKNVISLAGSDQNAHILATPLLGIICHRSLTDGGPHKLSTPRISTLPIGYRLLHVLLPEPVFLHHKRQAKCARLRFPDYINRCLREVQLSTGLPHQIEPWTLNVG